MAKQTFEDLMSHLSLIKAEKWLVNFSSSSCFPTQFLHSFTKNDLLRRIESRQLIDA